MSYANDQSARDAAHAREYRAWIATLPPAERARLTTVGLDNPDTTRRTSTRHGDHHALAKTASPAPSPREVIVAAEATTEPVGDDSSPLDAVSDPDQLQTAAADVLAAFCARVRSHPNPLLALDALCFATGLMDLEGLSQKELAARHGVTPAAFSKVAVQMSDTFGLLPSRGMRSRAARRAHRAARLAFVAKNHEHAPAA
jgi:hypothetical protein